ncbi:hypothetical protein, partial [Streptomyces prasinus]|uniref:hypothetical protein n=1 Tax=Streptomyces prasinus TaxID=67345 RepID=UPI00369B08BC
SGCFLSGNWDRPGSQNQPFNVSPEGSEGVITCLYFVVFPVVWFWVPWRVSHMAASDPSMGMVKLRVIRVPYLASVKSAAAWVNAASM